MDKKPKGKKVKSSPDDKRDKYNLEVKIDASFEDIVKSALNFNMKKIR